METIEKVIERCRFRIERSLDCNVADVLRLIEEIEKKQQVKLQLPPWAGLGTGD
jgi:hypothetical protein